MEWDVRENEHLGEFGQLIGVPTGQFNWVAIQVIEHLFKFER